MNNKSLQKPVLLRMHKKSTDTWLDLPCNIYYDHASELSIDFFQRLVNRDMPGGWEVVTFSTSFYVGELGYVHD